MDSSWAISNPGRWCCESAALNMPANLENSAVATGLEKVSFHYNPKKKAMPKNVQITSQLHSSHMLANQCSKFSKPGFNSMWTKNFQVFKLDLEKAEEPEIKLPKSTGSLRKQESSRKKHLLLLYWLYLWLCRSQQTVENSERDGNARPPDLPLQKSACRSRSNS